MSVLREHSNKWRDNKFPKSAMKPRRPKARPARFLRVPQYPHFHRCIQDVPAHAREPVEDWRSLHFQLHCRFAIQSWQSGLVGCDSVDDGYFRLVDLENSGIDLPAIS